VLRTALQAGIAAGGRTALPAGMPSAKPMAAWQAGNFQTLEH